MPELRNTVREQYQRYPYPPIPRLALPRRGQGEPLCFEKASTQSHHGIRILVAGAGTLEPLIVAQAHPHAAEVVAIDLSDASLARLKTRIRLAKLTRPFRKLPPIRLICGDIHEWQSTEPFDYILASNMLHHVEDPAFLLGRMSSWLKDQGILRVVTYPKASRIWMRQTSNWLKLHPIEPGKSAFLKKTQQAVLNLPLSHPIRSCFLSQPETGTTAGLVDAFFNACETPLSPLEWKEASARAGLSLLAEGQDEGSRSSFLENLVPQTRILDSWTRLQILDDLLELCCNPILWFKKTSQGDPALAGSQASSFSGFSSSKQKAISPALAASSVPQRSLPDLEQPFKITPHCLWEIAQGLHRAKDLLAVSGASLESVLEKLKTEVGPRVTAPPDEKPLPGLALCDYDWKKLLALPPPLSCEEWEKIQSAWNEAHPGRNAQLQYQGKPILGTDPRGAQRTLDGALQKPSPEASLADQAHWIETLYGPLCYGVEVRLT